MGDVINLAFHRIRSTNDRAHKFRYSAPSRLQNLEEFYEENTHNSVNKNQISNLKAKSLSDLLTLNNISYIVPSLSSDSDITDINSHNHNAKNMHINSHTTDEPNNNDSKFQSNSAEIARHGCMNSTDKNNKHQHGSKHQETNQSTAGTSISEPCTDYLENGLTSTKFEELRNKFIILGNENYNCKKISEKIKSSESESSGVIYNLSSAITKDLKIENDAKQTVTGTVSTDNLSESPINNSTQELDDDTFVEYSEHYMPVKKAVCRSQSDSACQNSPPLLHRRKSVHFADSRGLDLEIRISFAQADDYKTVPPRLMEALEKVRAGIGGEKIERVRERGGFNNLLSHFSLIPNFHQPFLDANFQQRVRDQMVCLESISILPNSHSITGVIRVVNLEFEKRVSVRFTLDDWETQKDIPACYVSSLSDHNQDQFSFHVVAPKDMHGDDRIEMAICYKLICGGREFWDNNRDENYVITHVEHITSRSDDAMMT